MFSFSRIAFNVSLALAVVVCGIAFASGAKAQVSQKYLSRKMDQAFRALPGRNGEIKMVVPVQGENPRRNHSFNVRSIGDFKRKGNRIVKKGLIWHIHTGYDDKVRYEVIVEKGKKPRYKILEIEYRGFLKNGKKLDLRKINKFLPVGSKISDPIVTFLTDIEFRIRRKREGKWEVAAQIVVEAIAKRLDREIN